MVFSSPLFLFGFLPVALLLYYASPRLTKNIVLLFLSLIFYAWGEVFYLAVMIASILSNYFFGRLIYSSQEESHCKKLSNLYLTFGIIVNIGLLIAFKYSNFIVDNLNILLSQMSISLIVLEPVHLPLGISFFTFQAISYIVDVYRKEVPSQKNIFHLALYISLFPQLIAGPIVRYHDISEQITGRSHSLELFASGVKRLIYGLSKKMLIANPLGEVADKIFALTDGDLTLPLAWIGILAYTLQIYFDFSGYSDMAIGLGRMFGFNFLENFNYPYIAKSLREFWGRWHISLSTWFRDYVYISLGGNRVSAFRVYVNLLVVFMLTGIWHGASWNFLIWGLFHGFFLAIEHAGFSAKLKKTWKPVQHIYLLLIVVSGWVFFRADTFSQSIDYLHSLVNISNFQTTKFQFAQVLSNEVILAFSIGSLLVTPVYVLVKNYLMNVTRKSTTKIYIYIDGLRVLTLSTLIFISISKIASSTYNPFIYFRF